MQNRNVDTIGELLRGLRDRHNLMHKAKKQPKLSVGDVVIIKREESWKWPLGIAVELYPAWSGQRGKSSEATRGIKFPREAHTTSIPTRTGR